MFKILGWGFGSVARVLDAASSTIDIVLAPSASSLKSQRTIAVAEHDTLSLGSRHDDRGGRVMSKEEILQSNGVGGSSSLRAGFKAARECFDNQPSLLDGYNNQAEQLRSTEFKRLGSKVYVDHAGATLYSEKQLEHAYKDLKEILYTNPHSDHRAWGSDVSATECEAEARALTLAMCNAPAEDYECIFTSGATGAMKVVAEAFPWSEHSTFAYTLDNHNSVVGMRGYALWQQASAMAVHIMPRGLNGPLTLEPCGPRMRQHLRQPSSTPPATPATSDSGSSQPAAFHSLFAYPLESNFSGVCYGLQPIMQAQQHGVKVHGEVRKPSRRKEQWHVFLDAAKACGSKPPDLQQAPADFVALSYYKIFGYPTGLGALLVRKDALKLLSKRYFGGGAVSVSVADRDFFRQRPGAAGFEDGTPAYLGISALKPGFAQIERFGSFLAIERHTASLTRYLAHALTSLRHANGIAVCELYGAHAMASVQQALHESEQLMGRERLPGAIGQGPVVAFNLFRSCGSYIGYREVEKVAGLAGIMLRTGCFCNPGACQAYLGLSHKDVISNYEAGHVCWDDHDIIDGRPTGAVRVSFGHMSLFSDAHAVVRFVEEYFVEGVPAKDCADPALESSEAARLTTRPYKSKSETGALAADDSSAEPATSGLLLTEQDSIPLSNDLQGLDADEAVLDQAHPSRITSAAASSILSAASTSTADDDEHSSPAANSASAVTAVPRTSAAPGSKFSAAGAKDELGGHCSTQAVISTGAAAGAVCGPESRSAVQGGVPVRLERIWVYPIKSCAGFAPSTWPLGLNGLLYDREWAIVDADGEALTQKRLPKLATIKPVLDLEGGTMQVFCPAMPNSITVGLPNDAGTSSAPSSRSQLAHGQPNLAVTMGNLSSSASHQADGQPNRVTASSNGPAAQELHRLAKSSPPSLQPTPVKAPESEARGSSSPVESIDAHDTDACSVASSAVSHSGHSLISQGSSSHVNHAIWPGRSSLEQGRSASAFMHAGSCQAPMSRSGSAAEPSRNASNPRARGKGPLDVKTVRDRFRHLRSAASLGGTSQQSMPSRASIDTCSSPKALQHSPLKMASVAADSSPQKPQSRHPQGTPVRTASPAHAYSEVQHSAEPSQTFQLPEPHRTAVSEASILKDFKDHREALQAKSGRCQETPGPSAAGQDAQNDRAETQQRASEIAQKAGSLAVETGTAAEMSNHGSAASWQRQIQVCSSRVCGLQVGTQEVQETVSAWFSQALGIKCWLVQQQAGSRQALDRAQLAGSVSVTATSISPTSSEASVESLSTGQRRSIGFANEGQFLAISTASLQDVNQRLQQTAAAKKREAFQVSPERFRPNLVFSGSLQPYAEDTWQTLSIGSVAFSITGPCARCEMVCTDQEAGKRGGPEPLLTLAAYRRKRGRIHFGVLLDHAPARAGPEMLQVDAPVSVQGLA